MLPLLCLPSLEFADVFYHLILSIAAVASHPPHLRQPALPHVCHGHSRRCHSSGAAVVPMCRHLWLPPPSAAHCRCCLAPTSIDSLLRCLFCLLSSAIQRHALLALLKTRHTMPYSSCPSSVLCVSVPCVYGWLLLFPPWLATSSRKLP